MRIRTAADLAAFIRERRVKLGMDQSDTEARVDDAQLVDRIRLMAQALPDQAAAIQEPIQGKGLSHVTITGLCRRLRARAVACQRLLQLSRSSTRP